MSKIREFWWDFLDAWDQLPAIRWTVIGALAVALVLFASFARAIEPGWYAPDDNGEAFVVRCNNFDQCAALWATYGKRGEQLWLVSTELCPLADSECTLSMAQTTGTWRGTRGRHTVHEPTVDVTITQNESGVHLRWEVNSQFPEICFETGSGGKLLEACVGKKQFDLLAR